MPDSQQAATAQQWWEAPDGQPPSLFVGEPADVEWMGQMLFEGCNPAAVLFAWDATLALAGAGVGATGLVVHAGGDTTTVTAVVDGRAMVVDANVLRFGGAVRSVAGASEV